MFSDVVMIMVVGVGVIVLVTLLVTSLTHTGLLKNSHYFQIRCQSRRTRGREKLAEAKY